jgi:hypothetical protein
LETDAEAEAADAARADDQAAPLLGFAPEEGAAADIAVADAASTDFPDTDPPVSPPSANSLA